MKNNNSLNIIVPLNKQIKDIMNDYKKYIQALPLHKT